MLLMPKHAQHVASLLCLHWSWTHYNRCKAANREQKCAAFSCAATVCMYHQTNQCWWAGVCSTSHQVLMYHRVQGAVSSTCAASASSALESQPMSLSSAAPRCINCWLKHYVHVAYGRCQAVYVQNWRAKSCKVRAAFKWVWCDSSNISWQIRPQSNLLCHKPNHNAAGSPKLPASRSAWWWRSRRWDS